MTNPLPPSAHAARLQLYIQGLTDTEIARIEGVTWKAIQQWRRRHGLAGRGPSALSQATLLRRWRRYAKGLSDTEVARLEGVSRAAITQWRRYYGLPPNYRPGNAPASDAARARRADP